MRDCIAHQFGCSCEEGQCKSKAVSLGTVKKANDMAGVFNVPQVDQLIRIAMFGVFVLVVWATFEAHDKSQRTALINQEDVSWK